MKLAPMTPAAIVQSLAYQGSRCQSGAGVDRMGAGGAGSFDELALHTLRRLVSSDALNSSSELAVLAAAPGT